MWYLTNLHTDKVVFVKEGKTTIGRKGSEIELENDQSLSRIHAFLILDGNVLKVQDAKSKYGTFLNDKKDDSEKLDPNQSIILKDGDSVLFGKFNNEWIVHNIKYKTAISMLDQPKREKLTKILKALDVKIAGDFDESCSHLTMPMQTDVSHKLLQALTMCKPIVNPKFWLAFQEAFAKNQPIPKYLDYLPKIKEETFIAPESVSLAMNENRRTVFNGKTFVFFSSSQMDTYEDVIKNGGGKCLSVSRSKVTMTQCCAKRTVVIQCKDNATQSANDETISKVRAALAKKRLRMVPEMEIGIAVLNASTDLWCNPEQSAVASLLISTAPSLSQVRITKSKTLVHESLPNSEAMGPPPSKKSRQHVVQEVVNLDSDEEEEVNKENVPEVAIDLPETQTSVGIVLPETQNSVEIELPETPLNLPETQESYTSAVSQVEVVDKVNNNRRSLRSASKSPQKINNSLSNVSVASAPISDTDLFNFTSSNTSRNTRKRKNSEPVDESMPSTSKRATGAKKTRVIVDEDSEEEVRPLPPPAPKASTRKRPATESSGLFTFNTSFAKRLKSTEESQDVNDTAGPSGIVALPPRPVESTPVSRIADESDDDSCDSGVWLSRAMTSVSIDDSSVADIFKTEPIELKFDSEDVKLSRCSTLFSVLENSIDASSSMLSKRKQFVKKRNFKPQSNVVTMKVIRVADELARDDDF